MAHEAFFGLPADDPTTDEEESAFGFVSVFFMVFPYIREFVHLLTGNSGFPALLLTPLRVPIDPAIGIPRAQPELTS
jgi:hypothetical protein